MTYTTTLLNTPSNDLHHPVVVVLQRALIAALEGDIAAPEVATFLAELAQRQESTCTTDVASDIVDLIWIMDIESETIGQQRQDKLRELTTAIIVRPFFLFVFSYLFMLFAEQEMGTEDREEKAGKGKEGRRGEGKRKRRK